MSARDKIKAANDLLEEIVDFPEWDLKLIARGMSAADAASLATDDGSDLYAQRLLSRCVFDEAGDRVYPTSADAAEVMAKNLHLVRRLLAAVNRVNGLDSAEVKKD